MQRSKTTKEAEEATKKFGLEAGLLKVSVLVRYVKRRLLAWGNRQ